VLTTNQKGAIAEMAIAQEAIKIGVGVLKPLFDLRYDLVFDTGAELLRVQCKWAIRRDDVVSVPARRCRRSREGHVHRSYRAHEIDAIAAYCAELDTCYLLPRELSVGRCSVLLRLRPTRNNQQAGIRWAQDYELGATLSRALGP
jgi:PD-(D/E)XK endonuclease